MLLSLDRGTSVVPAGRQSRFFLLTGRLNHPALRFTCIRARAQSLAWALSLALEGLLARGPCLVLEPILSIF